jgi:tripartite-type tricarboxylate transporter receptor subunit TctC
VRRPTAGTVLLALSSISILPRADKMLARRPAYTLNQLKADRALHCRPTVLVVRGDAPWKSFAELVADASASPAPTTTAAHNYGTMHVPMEMLKSAADFRMVYIPFTGAGPAVIALLGGQVDAIASGRRQWRNMFVRAGCARWLQGRQAAACVA